LHENIHTMVVHPKRVLVLFSNRNYNWIYYRLENSRLKKESVMKSLMKPAEKYIKRGVELEQMQTRIDCELKRGVERAAAVLDTSLNRFVEAALKWYLDALRRDGDI
jgi:hypothetical protein